MASFTFNQLAMEGISTYIYARYPSGGRGAPNLVRKRLEGGGVRGQKAVNVERKTRPLSIPGEMFSQESVC